MTAFKNPILDTKKYKMEYTDRYKTVMAANAIANNLLAEVDQDVKRFVLFDNLIYRLKTMGQRSMNRMH